MQPYSNILKESYSEEKKKDDSSWKSEDKTFDISEIEKQKHQPNDFEMSNQIWKTE